MVTTISANGKEMVAVILGETTNVDSRTIERMRETLISMMQTALLPEERNQEGKVNCSKLRTYVDIINAFRVE